MKRDISLYISDIIESISFIEEYIKNITINEFVKDQKAQDAVQRRLEIIGEAVKQLPTEFKTSNTDIPWRRIGGLRDILTHEYFGIIIDRIWKIVQKDLPELKNQLKKLQTNIPPK